MPYGALMSNSRSAHETGCSHVSRYHDSHEPSHESSRAGGTEAGGTLSMELEPVVSQARVTARSACEGG